MKRDAPTKPTVASEGKKVIPLLNNGLILLLGEVEQPKQYPTAIPRCFFNVFSDPNRPAARDFFVPKT